MRVVTWQAPCGNKVDVTPKAERALRAADAWPRCRHCGQQYAQVSFGLHDNEHSGGPVTATYTGKSVEAILAGSLTIELDMDVSGGEVRVMVGPDNEVLLYDMLEFCWMPARHLSVETIAQARALAAQQRTEMRIEIGL